jgi:phage terminase small subunit
MNKHDERPSAGDLIANPPEDVKTQGPAMAALTPQRRRFVEALFEVNPGRGALAAAARRAGYADNGHISDVASRLCQDEKIIAAIAEYGRKRIRSEVPQAVQVVKEIMSDPSHKDRLKAANLVFDRIDPVETKSTVTLETKTDTNTVLVAWLRRELQKGTDEARLVEELGRTGYLRFKKMLELEDASKKPIDVEFAEVGETEDERLAREVADL